jgi:hypothetical protein
MQQKQDHLSENQRETSAMVADCAYSLIVAQVDGWRDCQWMAHVAALRGNKIAQRACLMR